MESNLSDNLLLMVARRRPDSTDTCGRRRTEGCWMLGMSSCLTFLASLPRDRFQEHVCCVQSAGSVMKLLEEYGLPVDLSVGWWVLSGDGRWYRSGV